MESFSDNAAVLQTSKRHLDNYLKLKRDDLEKVCDVCLQPIEGDLYAQNTARLQEDVTRCEAAQTQAVECARAAQVRTAYPTAQPCPPLHFAAKCIMQVRSCSTGQPFRWLQGMTFLEDEQAVSPFRTLEKLGENNLNEQAGLKNTLQPCRLQWQGLYLLHILWHGQYALALIIHKFYPESILLLHTKVVRSA